MNANLINYLEFLENSSKFKAMDKAAKAQMLSQINELIKREALWVRNSHKDEIKRRISEALFARLSSQMMVKSALQALCYDEMLSSQR
ncbi:MAG: hypothetical protein SPE49_04615 [Campylobacter sp.]|uniref:hypothetical protein n=1 Tax=Campylobacter sp. TaxID=205 RepID=UPI002A80D4E1|nr:hypothetical protein [Campylobacter sp.]MDY5115236.1 hypothetical protein [Campylobacter sp.]